MSSVSTLVVATFLLITAAEGQPEVECLTSCGSSGAILRLEETVGGCCTGASAAAAFNIPGAGLAIDCAPCSDYQDIPGEIEFSFTPQTPTINQPLVAECVVITDAGLSNPLASIAWLGPDSSIFSNQQNVGFNLVTRNGVMVLEARLSINFPQFSASDFGEHSCIAIIRSDSFPSSQTNILRSVQIPASADVSQIPVPVYPIGEPGDPVAGQTYSIDCIVSTPGLTNADIQWLDPTSQIVATSDRVSVRDVVEDSNGKSVRTLRFNRLSTGDSGPYTCITTQNSSGIQTLTVDVPMPATVLNTMPMDPIFGEPLLIDCTSAVPESLQGMVTITLFGPDGSVLAVETSASRASAMLSIANATDANSGDYECLVSISSSLLVSEGNPRPLQDTAMLSINISTPVNECESESDNCDQNAMCMDLPDGFACFCLVGFSGSGVEGDCNDINECVAGQDDCAADEICRNNVGSFSCDPRPTQLPTTPTDTPSVATPTDTPSVATPTDTPSVATLPKPKPTFIYPTYPTYPTYPHPPVGTPPNPQIPIPLIPNSQTSSCIPPCHTNGQCVQTAANMFECRCKDGYQGNGVLCCISNVLIDLLREQARRNPGPGEGEDDEEENDTATTRRSKGTKRRGRRRSKGTKRRGRRHKSKSHHGSRSTRPCTKKNRSPRCREEESSPPPLPQQPNPVSSGFEINLVSVPEQCRDILTALVLEGL